MKRACLPRGFSLLELLIVIAIFGIVGSMASLAWQRVVANNNLRTAARDLAADIALCRQRAVGESVAYTITFNVAGNNYTMAPGGIVKLPSAFGSGSALASTTFVGDVMNIQPRGLLDNGVITMTNARSSSATLTVDIAGRVRVEFAMQ